MELRSETNDENGKKKVELKVEIENKQLEEGNEASKTGNSQEELADSTTIAISTSQSADLSSELELEETKIYVPNWLIEVLAFICRKEMANSSLSFSNKIFQLLCWPKLHQKVKPHKIPDLWCKCKAICHNMDNFRAEFQFLYERHIPIASIPAPHYINGFGSIRLDFLDEQVVDFIKSIDRLLQNCDLCVLFFVNYLEMDKKYSAPIHALLEYLANKIFKFTITSLLDNFEEPFLKGFNRLFPGILDQIEFLHFDSLLAIDDIDAIHNWLTNQSIKGKQKIIQFNPTIGSQMGTFINHIKEEFSNSNSPSIFFIYFYIVYQISEEEFFTLENPKTNEILTFYRSEDQQDGNWNLYYLARYPREEEHWKEDGQSKIEKAKLSDSAIIIDI